MNMRDVWDDYRNTAIATEAIVEKYGFRNRERLDKALSKVGLMWRRPYTARAREITATCPGEGVYCGFCTLVLPVSCNDRKECKKCEAWIKCPCWREYLRKEGWEADYDAWLTKKIGVLSEREGVK